MTPRKPAPLHLPYLVLVGLLAVIALSCGAASPIADMAVETDESRPSGSLRSDASGPPDSSSTASSTTALPQAPTPPPAIEPPDSDTKLDTSGEPDVSPSEITTPLPPAPVGFESLLVDEQRPHPSSITIDTIDVSEAVIVAVGVNDDLSFEVPPADLVGWYEFGPRPGEDGSSVLAAHVAYDGIDGVFRYLADVDVGSVIEVGFDDGSLTRYRVTSVTDYEKEELPASLFAQTGDPQLALITCGGAFNPELRSFDSNTVVVAVPV